MASDQTNLTSVSSLRGAFPSWTSLPVAWRRLISVGSIAFFLVIFVLLATFSGLYVRKSVNDGSDLSRIEGIQLKELIRKVKADLTAADQEAAAKGELALFRLKDFELDINVVASGSAETKGQIMTVGSNVTVGSEKVQKIHLRWVVEPEQQIINPQHSTVIGEATVSVDAE